MIGSSASRNDRAQVPANDVAGHFNCTDLLYLNPTTTCSAANQKGTKFHDQKSRETELILRPGNVQSPTSVKCPRVHLECRKVKEKAQLFPGREAFSSRHISCLSALIFLARYAHGVCEAASLRSTTEAMRNQSTPDHLGLD